MRSDFLRDRLPNAMTTPNFQFFPFIIIIILLSTICYPTFISIDFVYTADF